MSRDEGAWRELLDRFGPLVERIVASTLGIDTELADVIQQVFLHILEKIDRLRDPPALKSWIATVAVFTARAHIRKRRRGRWIRFVAPERLWEVEAHLPNHEARSLLRSTYRVLDLLRPEDRLALTLRFVAGMELHRVAAACRVSLATVKRRLARGERHFLIEARRDPSLHERIKGGRRWEQG